MKPKSIIKLFALTLIFLQTSAINLLAQSIFGNGNAFNNSNSPTPNSEGLVNLYNGQPNVSIPLYNIEEGDISVPISINYNTSGLKADDRGGMTGVGWNINAGGFITRELRGRDDLDASTNQTILNAVNSPSFYIDQDGNIQGSNKKNMLKEIMSHQGVSDAEYDIFTVNCNGIYAKFIVDKATNYSIIKLTPNDYTITRIVNGGETVGFSINTNTGFTYFFGDELASSYGFRLYSQTALSYSFYLQGTGSSETPLFGLNFPNVCTTWFIRKIASSTNHEVTFHYGNYSGLYSQQNVAVGINGNYMQPYSPGQTMNFPHKAIMQINNTCFDVNGYFWFYIDYGNSKRVYFNTQHTNPPPFPIYVNSQMFNLTSLPSEQNSYVYNIQVCKNLNTIIKEFEFDYQHYAGERAWLNSIKLNNQPLYTFQYTLNTSNERPHFIDGMLGDHWGYENGIVDYVGSNGNREPVFANSSSGLLKEIKNSLNGTTTITYESNNYIDINGLQTGGGVRVEKIKSDDGIKQYVTKYDYNDPATGLTSGKLMCNPDKQFNFSTWSSLNYNQIGLASVNMVNSPYSSSAQGSYVGYDYVRVTKYDGTETSDNGSELYHFFNQSDDDASLLLQHAGSLINADCIFPRSKDYSNSNGTLLSRKVFNSSNILVANDEYVYALQHDPVTYMGLNLGGNIDGNSPQNNSVPSCDELVYSTYELNTDWFRLESNTSTSYNVSGDQLLSSTTSYFYDYPDFKNTVTQQNVSFSDGAQYNTYFKYLCAASYSFNTSTCSTCNENERAMFMLKHDVNDNNLPLTLIEKYNTLIKSVGAAEEVISASLQLYKEESPGSNIFMFSKAKSLKISPPFLLSNFNPSYVAFNANTLHFDSHYEDTYEIMQRDYSTNIQTSAVTKAGYPVSNPVTHFFDINGKNSIANVINAKVEEKPNFLFGDFYNDYFPEGDEFGYTGFEKNNGIDYFYSSNTREYTTIDTWVTPDATYIPSTNWLYSISNFHSYDFAHTGHYSYRIKYRSNSNLDLLNSSYHGHELSWPDNKTLTKIFKPTNQSQHYLFNAWVYTCKVPDPNQQFLGNNHTPRKVGELIVNLYDHYNPPNLLQTLTQSFNETNGQWKKEEIDIDFAALKTSYPTLARLQCYVQSAYGTWDAAEDTFHIYVDDMRFQPKDAFVTTYNYNDNNQVTSTLDFYNEPTGFIEYDSWGRVIKVRDRDSNILTFNNYHFVDPQNSTDNNFTETIKLLEPNKTFDFNNLSYYAHLRSVEYSDWLGKPLQSVAQQASPNGNDIVLPYDYDDFGRSVKSFLPYVSNDNDGRYQSNAISHVQNTGNLFDFYFSNPVSVPQTTVPFAKTIVESSPLNRVLEQGAPGEDWQPGTGHTVGSVTETNGVDEVENWLIDYTNNHVHKSGFFAAGTMIKKTVTNEQGKSTVQFYDKTGKIICAKVNISVNSDGTTSDNSNGGEGPFTVQDPTTLSTYYVYDDFGRLIYQISPKAYEALAANSYSFYDDIATDVIFKELIIANQYDSKGRLIASKQAGENWTCMVYNKLNKPVLSQDANQRAKSTPEWCFIKYDNLGRTIITGIYKSWDTRQTIQNMLDQTNNSFELWEDRNSSFTNKDNYYTNNSFPNNLANMEPLTISLFDNYNFNSGNLNYNSGISTEDPTDKTKGMPTETFIKVLNTTSTFLYAVNYYDSKKRLLQQQSENLNGGFDVVTMFYNFLNQITNTDRRHFYTSTSLPLHITNNFSYDNQGRLLDVYQQTGLDPQVHISHMEYNELGTMIRKNLHIDDNTGVALQHVDYRYNIRGWLTNINNASLYGGNNENPDFDDVFGEEINYNSTLNFISGKNALPYYDGTISSVKWKTKDLNTDPVSAKEHAYIYRYDELNQMTAAYYATTTPDDLTSNTEFNNNFDFYNETLHYDVGGNITALVRNDGVLNPAALIVDNLEYTYNDNSNRLHHIIDGSNDTHTNFFIDKSAQNQMTSIFGYDNNANINSDPNKGLTTDFNFLNLPQTVTIDGQTITYTYDALGRKLKSETGTKTTEYINGIQYTNGVLNFIPTSEGRVRPKSAHAVNPTDYVYDYFMRDHLGNVRVIISEEDNRFFYLATMEDQNDATERQLFDHVPDTRADRPATCPADGAYSPDDRVSQLNADDGTTIGHAKILQVNEGDEMTFDARYFFHDSTVTYNPNPVTSILASLAGIFSTNGLLTTLNPEQAAQFLEQTASAGSPLGNFISNAINNAGANSPDAPQAFLVYLFFDNQFNLHEDKSGLLQASDPETLGDLAVQNLHADQDGFVYIYVTNESDYDVNFNNLRIAHLTSHVLEVNNYYPYGLLNKSLSWQRTANNYKYQTKELQNDFGYNVLDFGARHYDPVTARWTTPDPLGQFANTYYAMGGNPVSCVDPSGMASGPYSGGAGPDDPDIQHGGGYLMSGGSAGGGVPWYGLPSGSGADNYANSNWDEPNSTVAQMQLQHGTAK